MNELESKQALENIPPKMTKMSLSDYRLGMSNIIYQVSIAKDGNTWCALIGQDLQRGIGGFGESIQGALRDLADKIPK